MSNYSTQVLADVPQAYYRLDEASGNLAAVDSSGNGNNGTYNASGVTQGARGAISLDTDTCITLDGASGYATMGNVAALNPAAALTVEAWIKWSQFSSDSSGHFPISMSNAAADGYFLEQATGSPYNVVKAYVVTTSGTFHADRGNLLTGTWYHVVATYDGAHLLLYINGAQVASVAATGTIKPTANSFLLGSTYTTGGAKFNGSIDEVAIYNTALSAARVLNHYTIGTTTQPYSVKIAGLTVAVAAGTLSIDLGLGKRGSAAFKVNQANLPVPAVTVPRIFGGALYNFIPAQAAPPTIHYQQYQTVQINDQNNAPIFGGYIDTPQESKPGFQSQVETQMACMDYRWITDKRVIFESGLAPDTTLAPNTNLAPGSNPGAKTYTNRGYDVIVQDIFNKYLAPEGVTMGMIFTGPYPNTTLAPSTTLAPNGPTQAISQVTFNYPTVTQALDALVKSASASGVTFYWSIDQNKVFWFVPYSYNVNAMIVDGTQIDQVNSPPYVNRANPLYRNTQYVAGGTTRGAPLAKSVTGDSSTRTWTMDYPLASAPSIDINGVSQSVGVLGQTGKKFYYKIGSQTITQDASGVTLTGSQILTVQYTPTVPNTSSSQNAAQITAQKALDNTTGIVESVLKDPNITSNADGVIEASQLLNVYGMAGTRFVFTTRIAGYLPGQQITVTYAPFAFSSTKMLVESVHIDDALDQFNIYYTVTAVIGPYDATWSQFFGKLLSPGGVSSAAAINIGI